MNQSRPRKLWREGVGGVLFAAGSGTRGGPLSLPIGRSRRSPSIRSIKWEERANRTFLRPALRVKLQRLQAARCAEHDNRRIFLVLGRRRHLSLRQLKRDAVTLV